MRVQTSCYAIAERHLGIKERDGDRHHPLIQWWLSLVGQGLDAPDEVPWCSGFVAGMAFTLGLPRSESAAARSWLNVGQAITLAEAEPENDIVILKRGRGPQPGPEVTKGAPGHVGFYAGMDARQDRARVRVIGGNQSNAVTAMLFFVEDVLGVRRLH